MWFWKNHGFSRLNWVMKDVHVPQLFSHSQRWEKRFIEANRLFYFRSQMRLTTKYFGKKSCSSIVIRCEYRATESTAFNVLLVLSEASTWKRTVIFRIDGFRWRRIEWSRTSLIRQCHPPVLHRSRLLFFKCDAISVLSSLVIGLDYWKWTSTSSWCRQMFGWRSDEVWRHLNLTFLLKNRKKRSVRRNL